MSNVERRTVSELRAAGQGDEMALVGYAALFNSESKDLGGFRETILPGAFTRALAEKQDVRMLINHDANQVLGRTKSGTLQLEQDERGLKIRCQLDPSNTAHRNLYASVKRGDISDMSFAFSADKAGQAWSDGQDERGNYYAKRALKDVNVYDTSAVTYPAYNTTSLAARSAEVSAEVRSIVQELVAKHNGAASTETRDESVQDMLNCLCKCLAEQFPNSNCPPNQCCSYGMYYMCDTYDDYIIASKDGPGPSEYYKVPFMTDGDGFKFGTPVPVEKEWVPSERAGKAVAEYRASIEQRSDDEDEDGDFGSDWDTDGDEQVGDSDMVKAAKVEYNSSKDAAKTTYKTAKDAAKAHKDGAKDAAKDMKSAAKDAYKTAKQAAKTKLAAAKDVDTQQRAAALTAEKRLARPEHLQALANEHADQAAMHQNTSDAHAQAAEAHTHAADALAKEASDREECDRCMGSCGRAECCCQNQMKDPWDVYDELDDEYGDDDDKEDERKAAKSNKYETRAEDGGKVRTKTVGDKSLPATAFAYVGDPDQTTSWKFPIHDADHARNALARWGQHKGIPKDKESAVYAKIVAAAKKFGIDVAETDAAKAARSMTPEEIEDWKMRIALALVSVG